MMLTKHDRGAVADDNSGRHEGADTCNQLEQLGHEALINGLDIL